jgi:TP901 family phage tail tape measure protein
MLTIPTIFKAIDQMTSPIRKMSGEVGKYGNMAERASAKSERLFNRIVPGIKGATRQMLSFISTAAIMTAVVGGIGWSAKQIMNYETELQNLKALTGLNGAEFQKFKGKIQDVAAAMGKGNVETTQLFTALANNQPELLKDADGLAAVARSTILLSQAAKMDAAPAGEAITQILNQYGQSAKDAARLVDILAAGSVAGSSEIEDTAAAIQQFGTNAKNMGVKIDESVALIELASKFKKGADAGVGLRNILTEIAKGSAQDPQALKDWRRMGVNIKVLTNTALPLQVRLKEISKIVGDNTALYHTFGKENMALAAGVLGNVDALDEMVKQVNSSGMAAEMAAENNDTLAEGLKRLRAAWERIVTGSDDATNALAGVKKVVQWLTDNLPTIVKWAARVLAIFALWWAINKVLLAISAAIKVLTFLQYAWNLAIYMNPMVLIIGAIILAVGVLIWLINKLVKDTKGWGKTWQNVLNWMGDLWHFFKGSLQMDWDILKDGFLRMVEAMVMAWKWGQNKLGKLSDEQYKKDIANIKAQQNLRSAAIKTEAEDLVKTAQRIVQGPKWEVQFKSELEKLNNTTYDQNTLPYPARVVQPTAPLVTKDELASGQAVMSRLHELLGLKKEPQKLELIVKTDAGTTVTPGRSSNNIMPVLKPGVGNW